MTDKEVIAWILTYRRLMGEWPGVKTARKRLRIGYKRALRLLSAAKASAEEAQQPDAFLKEMGVAPEYRVERVLVNKWGAPGRESKQIKVWLRTYADEFALAEKLRTSLEKNPAVLRRPDLEPGELFAVLSLPDLHVGMLAWHRETGENYDTETALGRMNTVAASLLSRLSGLRVSEIVFPVGNDIFHADTHENTTTAGTRVDVDSRWQKSFQMVAETLIKGPISWAAEIAPVRVIIIPGNHDYQRAFYLGEVMRWYYEGRGLPVEVDNSPRLRKYYRRSGVLLGFTHGAWVKPNQLPLIMATEAPEDWASSVWREWLLGHYHRKREMAWNSTEEVGGVRLRMLPSLASPDAWHYRQGFVGGIKEGTLSLYCHTGLWADHYAR
jgi:hypothetical protein